MKRIVAILGTLVIALSLAPVAALAAGPDPDGSIALAERFQSFARQIMRSPDVTPASWTESEALLQAAVRLDPQEPRYLRLLADEMIALNDNAGAAETLAAYRKLVPGDQTALVQGLDLLLDGMQSADEKMKYLHKLMAREPVPTEVRSVAAFRCAQLMLARSEPTADVQKMLETALTLDHLNINAMRLKYQLTAADAPPLDRVNQLLAMLQATPADPVVSVRIAEQMADAGLPQRSVLWYTAANGLYPDSGQRAEAGFFHGSAVELFMVGRSAEASALLDQETKVISQDTESWLILATIAKFNTDQTPADKKLHDDYLDVSRKVSIALSNQLMQLKSQAGDATATTRPVDSPAAPQMLDFSGDPDLLKKSGDPHLTDAYIGAASELAWFDLYFQRDTAAADPLLNVLGKLLNDHDVQLARLRGWRQYVGGDPAAATTKLGAVQDKDPLAALGMILIDLANPKKHDDALNRARDLFQKNPSGLVGAMIFGAFVNEPITLKSTTETDAIVAAMDAFPKDILTLLNQPQSCYIVRVDPMQDSFDFGEPILLRVSVENIGNADLAVGPGCALHPDLWFDAFLRGDQEQSIAGAAFERMTPRLVLPSGQNMSTIVRVDDGMMFDIFNHDPGQALTVNFALVTNPISVQPVAQGAPPLGKQGPGGQEVQISRMVQRNATPLNLPSDRAVILNRLKNGDGGDKIRAIEVLGTFLQQVRKATANDAKLATLADQIAEQLQSVQYDKSPAVASWSKCMFALISNGDDQSNLIGQLKQEKDWRPKLLSMVAATFTNNPAPGLGDDLSKDADPIVARYAAALAKRVIAPPPQGAVGQ